MRYISTHQKTYTATATWGVPFSTDGPRFRPALTASAGDASNGPVHATAAADAEFVVCAAI